MIKTLKNLFKQDKERFVVPRGVQDVIPIKAIFDDGIFQVGKDNVDAGHGLIKVGSSLIPFSNKFPKNTKLYRLMTTKPGEGA